MPRRSSHGISIVRHCPLSVRSRRSSTRHSNIGRSQHWAHLRLELLSWSLQKRFVTRYTQTNTSLWFTETKSRSIPHTRSSPTDVLFYSFWSAERWLLASKDAVCSSTCLIVRLQTLRPDNCRLFPLNRLRSQLWRWTKRLAVDSTEFVPRVGTTSCAMFASDAATGKSVPKGSQRWLQCRRRSQFTDSLNTADHTMRPKRTNYRKGVEEQQTLARFNIPNVSPATYHNQRAILVTHFIIQYLYKFYLNSGVLLSVHRIIRSISNLMLHSLCPHICLKS